MTPIKYSFGYIFRGSLLRIRVYWNGKRYIVSVGYNIDKTDSKGKIKWDGKRCVKNTTHGPDKVPASTINYAIDNLEEKIKKAFEYFEANDIDPEVDNLKDLLKGDMDKKLTVSVAYKDFVNEGINKFQWAESTTKKMRTIGKLLDFYKPNALFKDIDNDWLASFMAFQTKNSVSGESKNEKKKGKSIIHYSGKYQNDTINKNIQNVKWFLKWASDKGYFDYSKIEGFKLRYKKPKRPVIFLEWDELMRLYNLDLSNRPESTKTRDMFCFCCFTSLRYSDLVNLKWGNIKNDHIEIVTKKTSDSIVIDLNDYSRSILEKYRPEESNDNDPVFKIKSAQKMNTRLKNLAKECKIDSPVTIISMSGSERKDIIVPKYELISTHCGRRTFISNAISMGIPPNVVMKWTGHSDYKAMIPYIEISDQSRMENMSKFNLGYKNEDEKAVP